MRCMALHAAVLVGLLGAGPIEADAAGPTEVEQRAACLGDALRLCAFYIPDRARIRACLGAQHASLSDACRIVYDASVKAEALAATRQR